MQVQTRDPYVAAPRPARTRSPLDALDGAIDRHPALGFVLALVTVVALSALAGYCGIPK